MPTRYDEWDDETALLEELTGRKGVEGSSLSFALNKTGEAFVEALLKSREWQSE